MKSPVPVPTGIFLTALLFISSSSNVDSAKILFFFGVSTPSHRFTVWPLVEKLADRGHQVTFFQPFENKKPHPKVEELNPKLKEAITPDRNLLRMRLEGGRLGVQQSLTLHLPHIGVSLCEALLSDPSVLKWVEKQTKFDMVISDGVYNDCSLGFVYKFGAKHVIFGTTSLFSWWPDSYGFHMESNWLPDNHLSFPMPLSFFERVVTTLTPFYYYYQKRLIMYPRLEEILREKLNIPEMPSLDEIDRNTSLVLMNTHFSEEHARSLPPMVIPIGGMHCEENTKPLPSEIEKFIESSGDDGIIYVSFGSAVEISGAPKEILQIFFQAFKNSKNKFLWKWESKRPKEMPDNVYTAAWMPQQDILAHPKTRAFLTHGGLLGMQEAIYHGVPLVSIPIFAEQDYNTDRLVALGRGIALDIRGLTQEQLEAAIKTIVNDKSYRKRVLEASVKFKDRPEKPVDTAVWWVEYVIRHEDTSSLRPLTGNQYLFQRRLLDVWAFLFAIVVFLLAILVYLAMKIVFTILYWNAAPAAKVKKTVSAKKKTKKL